MSSTRWGPRPTKPFTENNLRIDIRQLNRDGNLDVKGEQLLTWLSRSGQPCSTISMYVHDDGVLFLYTINGRNVTPFAEFEYTACNLGGARIWFSCPGCGNCRAVLYIRHELACRKCHNLAYASQNEGVNDRRIRRSRKVADRVGAPTLLWSMPPRPKHMHHRTYLRQRLEYERAQFAALASLRF